MIAKRTCPAKSRRWIKLIKVGFDPWVEIPGGRNNNPLQYSTPYRKSYIIRSLGMTATVHEVSKSPNLQ